MNLSSLAGLNIESPIAMPEAVNFKPTSWPPEDDFPVVIDKNGNTVSKYRDARWDLSPWAQRTLTIHFGDEPGQGKEISKENAGRLREIVAWWIWGANAVMKAGTLVYRFESIKPIFVACTESNVLVTELYKYPKVIEVAAGYCKSRGERAVDILHSLFLAKDFFGYIILDEEGIGRFNSVLSKHEARQTPYIPIRIWSYQVNRLKECLDDFLENEESLVACYNFGLDAYAKNAGGSLSDSFGGLREEAPFNTAIIPGKKKNGKSKYPPAKPGALYC